jgi:hypothetical protein
MNGASEVLTEEYLRRFEDLEPYPCGWSARCPNHSRLDIRAFHVVYFSEQRVFENCTGECIWEDIRAALDWHSREPGEDDDDGEGPPGFLVSDLLQEDIPPVKWIVPGRLLEKSVALIAGPPGSGKTFLNYDWAAQAVRAGAGVYLGQNEGGKKAMQIRLARACAAAGLEKLPRNFRYERNVALALSDRKAVERFAKRLKGYDIIGLDSLSSFWPGLNENDPEHMSIVSESLKILCEVSGATAAGVHHTTKSSWKPGETPSLADIRGHGALAGRIDTAFIVKPLERVAGLVRFELHTVKQRDEDLSPACEMEILMTGSAATMTQVQSIGRAAKPPSRTEARAIVRLNVIESIIPVGAENAIGVNEAQRKLLGGTAEQKKAGSHKPDVTAAFVELGRTGRIQRDESGKAYRVIHKNGSDSSRFNRFNEKSDSDDSSTESAGV